MVTLNTEQISSRLRETASEPVMLNLTKRLILIASKNSPGNHYEECAHTLCDESAGASTHAPSRLRSSKPSLSELARERFISVVTTMPVRRRAAISFSHMSKAQICSVAAHRT